MKKNLLAILLLLTGGASFAQMNGDYNYTIAVKGYALMQMPKVMNEVNFGKYTNVYFKGGVLKFNDNQFSYRISGYYQKNSKTFYNNCTTCEQIGGDMSDYAFKLGFEKNLNFSRIQPYVGLDLGYRSNKFIGKAYNVNELQLRAAMDASSAIASTKVEATKVGFVASPILGLKFNPISQLTLFAETSLDFFYSYERQERVTEDINNTRTLSRTNKTEFLLNPVTVGIAVHLGNNK